MESGPGLTQLINRARAGDADAGAQALSAVYAHLKALALSVLGRGPQQTLSATAIVHEAYLRLFGTPGGDVNDRQHFFRLAARAMRQVLVDHARERAALKRGGDLARVELNDEIAAAVGREHDLIAIDQALRQLASLDPDLVELTEQYFFGGLTFEEIARARQVTDRTVRRDWDTARAFLLRALDGGAN